MELRNSAARTPEPGPVYHGTNLDAAYERAKSIGGMVIWSAAPNTNGTIFGYWSDESTLIRFWEREVYSAMQRRGLAQVKRAEAKYFPQGGAR